MDLIEIGHTKKTYGVKGDVRIQIYDAFQPVIEDLQFVFFEMDGLHVPWQISSWNRHPISSVKLSRLNDPESAAQVAGKPVFAARSDLPDSLETSLPDGAEHYSFLRGYHAHLEGRKQRLGIVEKVEAFPNQEMAIIASDDSPNPILVPLVEAFIADVDRKKKVISFDLPEGFLEL